MLNSKSQIQFPREFGLLPKIDAEAEGIIGLEQLEAKHRYEITRKMRIDIIRLKASPWHTSETKKAIDYLQRKIDEVLLAPMRTDELWIRLAYDRSRAIHAETANPHSRPASA